MFTGIIEAKGKVISTEMIQGKLSLSVDIAKAINGVKLGDSIAVNGVCLTVNSIHGNVVRFDAVSETVGMTTLGSLRSGTHVNIERALALGDRLGGHIVQGHVDGIGEVVDIRHGSEEIRIAIKVNKEIANGIILKGSISIDGISLTVAKIENNVFELAIIPHTWVNTTLSSLKQGSKVNIETDVLGKYIRKYMSQQAVSDTKPGMTAEDFLRNGFM